MKLRFLSDENELVKLFPLFISEGKEIGVDVTKLNPDKLWSTLHICMTQAAIIVCEEEIGIFSGTMVIVPIDSYWSDEITWLNLLYYVLPEYRQSRRALQLLAAARDCARAKNIEFNINVETLTDVERKDKLFARYGFHKRGGFYKLGDR